MTQENALRAANFAVSGMAYEEFSEQEFIQAMAKVGYIVKTAPVEKDTGGWGGSKWKEHDMLWHEANGSL